MGLSTNLQFVLDTLGWIIGSGGRGRVQSGGELDIENGGAFKIAGTQVTASAAELNSLHNMPTTWPAQVSGTPTIVIGAEASNVINVDVQLRDAKAAAVAESRWVDVYLSDDSAGDGLCATAPDGGVAIGTDGTILNAPVASKMFQIWTESTGQFDIDITHAAGAATYYLCIRDGGRLYVSSAIAFA